MWLMVHVCCYSGREEIETSLEDYIDQSYERNSGAQLMSASRLDCFLQVFVSWLAYLNMADQQQQQQLVDSAIK